MTAKRTVGEKVAVSWGLCGKGWGLVGVSSSEGWSCMVVEVEGVVGYTVSRAPIHT